MKKSLKVIASTAMVFSMFASVAMADTTTPATTDTTTTTTTTTAAPAAKTTKDFKDLAGLDATLLAKIDAMLAKGVFEGTADDSFGIEENMTRAQFAKVLDLIYGVTVDTTVTTSSFADVKADDNSNGWAVPFIEAAKKAGYIDGKSDTSFDPGANVTLGEFATALVKGLGKTVDQSGTPWFADAVKQAIDLKILPEGTDGSKVATRADLVVGAYGGQQAFADVNKPALVSVASVKATGVKTVQVTLDRDVDTAKATLTLKRGSGEVAVTTKWSDDKKSATLTLTDEKIRSGDYSVTLGGLNTTDIKTATGTFTGQDEVLQKLDFVSVNDTIAYANSTIVKVKPTNQYGEIASFNSGSYTVYPGGATFIKISRQDDGILDITLKTKDVSQQGVGVVSVSVVNTDQHITASKNFKVGTSPILSKLELGDVVYSNSANAITGKGDSATFDLNLFDQYGGNIPYDSTDFTFADSDVNVIWNDYISTYNGSAGTSADAVTKTIEDNGSNIPRLKLSLNTDVDKSGDYSFTVLDQAASATGKVTIQSAKVATKVEIGDFNDVIAAGDKDVYIPVIAYDAQGNQLSTDDLTSDTNRKRIQINVSGVNNYEPLITDSGEHRGSVHLKNIFDTSKSSVSLTLVVATPNATSTATRTWTISDVRIPDRIKEVSKPAKEIVAGAFNSFQYHILDQYGKVMDYNLPTVGINGNGSADSIGSGNVTYDVYVALTGTNASAFKVTRDDDSEVANVLTGYDGTILHPQFPFGSPDETASNAFKQFNKGLRIYANPTNTQNPSATLYLAIEKRDLNAGTSAVISHVEQSIKVAPQANSSTGEDWTYTLTAPDKIYNTLDSGILKSDPTITYSVYGGDSRNDQLQQLALKNRINFSVKNASGDNVGVPNDFVKSITSSNPSAVRAFISTSNHKAYVIGFKTGTSTISVTYVDNKGNTKTVQKTITVVGDAPTIASLNADAKVTVSSGNTYDIAADYSHANGTATALLYTEGLTNVSFVDSYGIGLDGNDINTYNFIYGLTFTVQHVSGTVTPLGGVTRPATYNDITLENGQVTPIAGFVGTFDVVITAPSGLSTTTQVTVN